MCNLTFTERIKFIGVFQEFSWSFQKTTILQNNSWWLLPYMTSVSFVHILYFRVRSFREKKVLQFMQVLTWFAIVYEVEDSLMAGSRKFICASFYMKSKILSMRPKSLKLGTHTKKWLIWLLAKVNSRKKSFLGLFAKVFVHKMQKFRDLLIPRRILVVKVSYLKKVQECFKL